jgi:2-dehydropantoate 2-reductase
MGIDPSARIAVAGAGSIGCYVGGRLAAAGRDVRLLLRPAPAAAVARYGLISDDGEGRACNVATRITPTSDAASALAGAEIVLVTVKCGATGEIAGLVARHAPRQAVVVSLQNGVDNPGALRAGVAEGQRVVAGMVPFHVVAERRPGQAPRFRRASSGRVCIAAHIPGLRAALDVPGARVVEHRDMPAVLWGKLLLNLNNALNALSGLPLAVELADRRWRLLLAAQLDEALAILRLSGVRAAPVAGVPAGALPRILRLPDILFRNLARRMLAIDAGARSSMWEDLQLRRPTEVAYLQGAVLRLAEARGLPAPLTRRIIGLIAAAEAAGAGPPGLDATEVAGAAGA